MKGNLLVAKFCIEKEGPALYLDCQECDTRLCEAFYCLVVGSRIFDNYELMKEKLDNLLQHQDKVVIVSGGAKGVDTLAEQYAHEKGYYLEVFPANWKQYGKRAGYIRNEEMHKRIAQSDKRGVVAFWDGKSKGTQHNFGLSEKYKNPLRIIRF